MKDWLPAFWVPKGDGGRGWFHSVRTHLLYSFHSGSFLVFSCACGPQSRHPSVLLDPENNTLPVFSGIKMSNGDWVPSKQTFNHFSLLYFLSIFQPYFLAQVLVFIIPEAEGHISAFSKLGFSFLRYYTCLYLLSICCLAFKILMLSSPFLSTIAIL